MKIPPIVSRFLEKPSDPERIAQAKKNQHNTMNSVKKIGDYLHLLDYQNDYYLDEFLAKGIRSVPEMLGFASQKFVGGGRFSYNDKDTFGCSTFNAVTPDGAPILGRNFDFKTAPCFVVWTHPENGYASVSVADCNFMAYGEKVNRSGALNSFQTLIAPYACVDGVNEKGLSIAVLQIRTTPTNQVEDDFNSIQINGLDSFPEAKRMVEENTAERKDIVTTLMIRAVLDKCATVDEAIALIAGYRMHDSLYVRYHYQIVDADGKSVIVEYVGNDLNIIDCASEEFTGSTLGCQYAANYYTTRGHGDEKAEEHGLDRTGAIRDCLTEHGGVLTELEAMDLLNRVKLNYDHPKYPWRIVALWSAVYNSKACTMKIAVNTDFTRIYNFSVNEPGMLQYQESLDEVYDLPWEFL